MLSDEILDEAWRRVSEDSTMRFPDTISLLDEIENIYGRTILSREYRSFWIDAALGRPSMVVSKRDFKELFRKLFEVDFDAQFVESPTLSTRETQSIRDETTRINALDETARRTEYEKKVHALRELQGQYGGDTELEINRKLVRYLSALNGMRPQRIQVALDRQDELLETLSRKFQDNSRARSTKTSFLRNTIVVLLSLMTVSYILSYLD